MLESLDIPELDTKVLFEESLSAIDIDLSSAVVFYDEKLIEYDFVKSFLEAKDIYLKIALKAGEDLKTLSSFSDIVEQTGEALKNCPSAKPCFVALGGGSVGDFVGFFASVFQRGCDLIHIPSTWLAAIDSSHGGKTALNTRFGKNQLGSFYQAKKIFLVRDLLFSQPEERLRDSISEILKVYMLIEDERKFFLYEGATDEDVFKTLKHCVEQKYLWVKKDPFEEIGIRQVLNLGHTLGHAFESANELSHGNAVAMGLCFCLRYSLAKKKLKQERYERLSDIFSRLLWWEQYKKLLSEVSSDKVRLFLTSDKKRTSSENVNFVLLTDLGHKVEETSVSELIEFLKCEIVNV